MTADMKVHFIQHVRFEHPGYLSVWAAENGFETSFTRIFEAIEFPPLRDFDMLVIMGGDMGVYEENKYPWLRQEKAFIRECIDADKKILGICLGSQLLAEVLGARVSRHHVKEIGWWQVSKIPDAGISRSLPEELIVFQWHGDTFELPENAIQLFRSEACEQQGFRYGKNVLALQFHLETTQELINYMSEEGSEELIESSYIQNPKTIQQLAGSYVSQQNKYLEIMLSDFLSW